MKIEKFHLNVESLTPGSHMSSSTSDIDYDDDGADRRKLTDGESKGDGHGTKMTTSSRRID